MASSSSSSSSSPSVLVSREEFNLFHTIERRLYALLVVSLLRDPAESMQVLALWLWLEARGLPHAVNAILSLPHFVVNELADEASACLALISSSSAATAALFSPSLLPLTQSVLETDHHPPGLIQALIISNSHSIALDLTTIVKNICLRTMSEITVVTITATAPVPVPAPAPAPTSTAIIINNNNTNNGRKSVGPPDSRTMFATFSKGYPVYEWEVRNFFGRAYGDACIEALHMQEVTGPNQQPLYARIVFSVPRIINAILQGSAKAKFTINGKHVWMRRFVPKKPRAAQRQQQQEQPPPSLDSRLPPPSSPPPEPETAEDEREPLPELPASLFD